MALDGIRYRIDRIEQGDTQIAEGVRVEPASYLPAVSAEEQVVARPIAGRSPVFPLFLDLPLLTGAEMPHAPHLAVTATPWSGPVALWSAASDAGYEVNRILSVPSVVGLTESALAAARSGLWDRGAALRVKVFGGTIASAAEADVLNGLNAAAIGDGTPDRWEVFQFARADLVAPQTYDIRLRLRGQAGTEAMIPPAWPEGSLVVFLDRGPEQIDVPLSARGLARHYRIGPALRGYDDTAVIHRVEAFQGVGLRPYAPVHLRMQAMSGGDLGLVWVRRTRIDGDSWESFEVPLGEDREHYLLRILSAGNVVREEYLTEPQWTYRAALRAHDGVSGPFRVAVAQVSDRFGAGPFAVLDMPG